MQHRPRARLSDIGDCLSEFIRSMVRDGIPRRFSYISAVVESFLCLGVSLLGLVIPAQPTGNSEAYGYF